jgi:hypothetical protein
MVHKIVDVNSRPTITPAQEKAIMRAFEEFEGGSSISVPQREHLGSEFCPGICCFHSWMKVDTSVPQNLRSFQENFGETEIGEARVCGYCGATALFENGHLWAYDATRNESFGHVEKRTVQQKPKQNRHERRSGK